MRAQSAFFCFVGEKITGRLSTVDEFAGILARDHGEIPVGNRSTAPVSWNRGKRPLEFAMYANYPQVKGLIRRAARAFREVESIWGLRRIARDERM